MVTPELLVELERKSESRENMLSNVDFSFVKAERCTCVEEQAWTRLKLAQEEKK